MTRLKNVGIKGERMNDSPSENNKEKGFFSTLPHRMKTGLIAGLALIGVATASTGCEPHALINNCNIDSQTPMDDGGVKPVRTCQVNGKIPLSLREGGSLMFGNTVLVDVNGNPVAKVILGSNSTPCEALAASYIAEAIAISTIRRTTLTSQIAGNATCSTTPECSCSVDMSGVYSVIMPGNAQSVSLGVPSPISSGPLVILDADAAGLNTVISVGNPASNTVSARLLEGSNVDWNANPKVVKEVVAGSKIVVAGAQAVDTASAAEDFVSQLKKTQ